MVCGDAIVMVTHVLPLQYTLPAGALGLALFFGGAELEKKCTYHPYWTP